MVKFALLLVCFGTLGFISSFSQAQSLDTDGDGISDRFERLLKTDPKDKTSKPADLDGDGIPDSYDLDIDGDGVNNWQDPFPNNALESADVDGDGVGDKQDSDSDGDGFSNTQERQAGTNPNDKNAFPDEDAPILNVLPPEQVVSERLLDIRGMAFDLGMGMKKIQVVNGEGAVFVGHFQYASHFKVKVRLHSGENELQVAAFDQANNVSRQIVNVVYRP